MKKYLLLVTSALSVIAVSVWTCLTDREEVPVHYNLYGEPDRYSTKWMLVFFAAIPLVLSVVYSIYDKYRKVSESNKANKKYEEIFIPAIILLVLAVMWVIIIQTLSGNKGGTDSMKTIIGGVFIAMGALMTIMSNYMAKLKPNKTFGLKTPWALKDETVWYRTHRLGGYTGVIGALVMMASGVLAVVQRALSALPIAGMLLSIILTAVVPFVYSYAIYKAKSK